MAEYIKREDAIKAIEWTWAGKAAFEALKKLPAADVVERKWIPVTERMPEVGKDVLCFCRAGIYFVLAWDGTHWHEGCDRYYMKSLATHWMPLPEPPKEET